MPVHLFTAPPVSKEVLLPVGPNGTNLADMSGGKKETNPRAGWAERAGRGMDLGLDSVTKISAQFPSASSALYKQIKLALSGRGNNPSWTLCSPHSWGDGLSKTQNNLQDQKQKKVAPYLGLPRVEMFMVPYV